MIDKQQTLTHRNENSVVAKQHIKNKKRGATMTDYKRLTERDEFGNADIIGIDSEILYENLIGEENNKLTNALNRFAELEDMIEQGLLVKLPAPLGTPLYVIFNRFYKDRFIRVKPLTFWDLEDGSIGEYAFFSRAEAEARLAELRGGE